MATCTTCGAPLAADARTCHLCGSPVSESAGELPLERIESRESPIFLDLAPESARITIDAPRPATGPAALEVYSADKKLLHTLPLDRDVTRIGRTDAVRGEFVDLDVAELFDEATSRKVSRKHALILRARDTHMYILRPLARNTGTQIEKNLAADLVDQPLTNGTRIVLGGVVRLKFVQKPE